MARRTCFREQYYTGMRRYNSAREDCRPRPKKTIYKNRSVYCPYLWIDQFVWARGFCGTRICCSASVDCSGTIGKIHVVEIEVGQGVAHAWYSDGFHHLGTFDEAPGTVQSPGVSGRGAGMVPPSLRDLQHCASVLRGS